MFCQVDGQHTFVFKCPGTQCAFELFFFRVTCKISKSHYQHQKMCVSLHIISSSLLHTRYLELWSDFRWYYVHGKLRQMRPPPSPIKKPLISWRFTKNEKYYDKFWIRSWIWFVLPSMWPLRCVLRLFLDLKNFWQMSHWWVFPSTWLSKWVFKSDCLLKPGKRKTCENWFTN